MGDGCHRLKRKDREMQVQLHDAHVKAWEATQWCPHCTFVGGYCGNHCQGAFSWFHR